MENRFWQQEDSGNRRNLGTKKIPGGFEEKMVPRKKKGCKEKKRLQKEGLREREGFQGMKNRGQGNKEQGSSNNKEQGFQAKEKEEGVSRTETQAHRQRMTHRARFTHVNSARTHKHYNLAILTTICSQIFSDIHSWKTLLRTSTLSP